MGKPTGFLEFRRQNRTSLPVSDRIENYREFIQPLPEPTKLGFTERQGWVAYQLKNYLFVKRFGFIEGDIYPDGGVNFETYTCDQFLEVESLGPMTDLAPGKTVKHIEIWDLFRDVPTIRTEADADRELGKRIRRL